LRGGWTNPPPSGRSPCKRGGLPFFFFFFFFYGYPLFYATVCAVRKMSVRTGIVDTVVIRLHSFKVRGHNVSSD